MVGHIFKIFSNNNIKVFIFESSKVEDEKIEWMEAVD